MELMQQPWDLLLTVFSETHTAGHDLWHLSQPQHPLHASQTLAQKLTPTLATDSISTDLIATDPTDLMSTNLMSTDPMLTAFQRVDQAIGDIVAAAPDGAQIVVFSVHGMGHNVTDMNSMTFLPELLYRYSFPGRVALGNGKFPAPKASPPYLHPRRKSWAGEVWQRRYDANPIKRWLMPFVPSRFDTWLNAGANPRLASPYDLRDRNLPLHWMPAMWYSPLWSQMAAFALPAFAAGHVRINLAGRDAHGVVDLADYDAVCDELSQLLHQLTDGRTGEPLVESVVRTRDRNQALQCDRDLPDADLVVLWRDRVTDVVDHPSLGRIGPLTYYRSGGHRPDGFVMLKSPRIAPGSSLPGGEVVDLAPTILDLMNRPRPDYFDGHSLLSAVAAR
jgi:predicted AlkP superfamily phosphohydrolase/phosphomutase